MHDTNTIDFNPLILNLSATTDKNVNIYEFHERLKILVLHISWLEENDHAKLENRPVLNASAKVWKGMKE